MSIRRNYFNKVNYMNRVEIQMKYQNSPEVMLIVKDCIKNPDNSICAEKMQEFNRYADKTKENDQLMIDYLKSLTKLKESLL